MTHTQLLKAILDKAEGVKSEFNHNHLTAAHIVVAVADLCGTKYTGFTTPDSTYFPTPFEEERLRYVFAQEARLASFFRVHLRHLSKEGLTEAAFDMASCENIAALRNMSVLSADTVFLCALKELHPSYKKAVRTIATDGDIIARLQDADKNVFDYVVDNIDKICSELKKKSAEAAALRDWKPAAKFAEPDELTVMFFEKIEKTTGEKEITLKLPKFFGGSCLKISIHSVDGSYYIHDNGCAIRHLKNRLKDNKKATRALNKVCHRSWIERGKVTGRFTDALHFTLYLQMLVFIAHADLYYTRAVSQLYCKEKGYVYRGVNEAQPIDTHELFDRLKKAFRFDYDEKEGLYSVIHSQCSISSTYTLLLTETLEGGLIRISDKRKGKTEGEILEEFYWCNHDIKPYSKFVAKLAARFGAEFDGKNAYLTAKEENVVAATFKFFNLAVLLCELGHNIALPKIRGEAK